MIFSLPKALVKSAERVLSDGKSVAYGWGNVDALNKWLIDMDKKQIDRLIGNDVKNKYPLIWLVEGWKGEEVYNGYGFNSVTFWIASNSDVSTLNQNRDFTTQYKVANDFINELNIMDLLNSDSIEWVEKSNVSTNGKSSQTDIWDAVTLTVDLRVNKNCLNKLYK